MLIKDSPRSPQAPVGLGDAAAHPLDPGELAEHDRVGVVVASFLCEPDGRLAIPGGGVRV